MSRTFLARSTPFALRPIFKPAVAATRFAPTSSLASFTTSAQLKMATSNEETKKEKKSYHTKATGPALATVKKRSKDHTLKLYGSCFWYVYLRQSQSVDTNLVATALLYSAFGSLLNASSLITNMSRSIRTRNQIGTSSSILEV